MRIVSTGMVAMVSAVRALGEAGKAVAGPLASWGDRMPYTRRIELPGWRRAGGAFMFRDGVAATLPQIPAIMLPAIPKGAGAVGQAKRKVRDIGIVEIRKRTPVRSGALREGVQEMTRPG